MTKMIGYIRNARSTGGGALPRPAPDLVARAPSDFADLDAALENMAAMGVQTLIIDGGDGTVREVISRTPKIWGPAQPNFAIVAHGNTNLIARSAGALPADRAVDLARSGPIRKTTLPLLRIDRTGLPTIRGFIMGAGAYGTVTRIAQEDIAARHGAQVAITLIKLIFSKALRAGDTFAVAHDNAAGVEEARMLFGMTSLPGKLIFGMAPFWNGGAGPIRWLDIRADPPAPLLAAPFVAYGAPMGWMRRAYRSGTSHVVEMTLSTDFVVDGERFSLGPDGHVVVTANETATFLAA